MSAHVRHFHLLSKQWSCELGLGLGFSLRAARVYTHHIYILICVFLYGFFPVINGLSLPTTSASAEMTLPSVVNDLLMFAPSLSRTPLAPVESALSLPARSTRLILLTCIKQASVCNLSNTQTAWHQTVSRLWKFEIIHSATSTEHSQWISLSSVVDKTPPSTAVALAVTFVAFKS